MTTHHSTDGRRAACGARGTARVTTDPGLVTCTRCQKLKAFKTATLEAAHAEAARREAEADAAAKAEIARREAEAPSATTEPTLPEPVAQPTDWRYAFTVNGETTEGTVVAETEKAARAAIRAKHGFAKWLPDRTKVVAADAGAGQ